MVARRLGSGIGYRDTAPGKVYGTGVVWLGAVLEGGWADRGCWVVGVGAVVVASGAGSVVVRGCSSVEVGCS